MRKLLLGAISLAALTISVPPANAALRGLRQFLTTGVVTTHISSGADPAATAAMLNQTGLRAAHDVVNTTLGTAPYLALAKAVPNFMFNGLVTNDEAQIPFLDAIAQAHALRSIVFPDDVDVNPITTPFGVCGGTTTDWTPCGQWMIDYTKKVRADGLLQNWPTVGIVPTGATPNDVAVQCTETTAIQCTHSTCLTTWCPVGTLFYIWTGEEASLDQQGAPKPNFASNFSSRQCNSLAPQKAFCGDHVKTYLKGFSGMPAGQWEWYGYAWSTGYSSVPGNTCGVTAVTEDQQGRIYLTMIASYQQQNYFSVVWPDLAEDSCGYGMFRADGTAKPIVGMMHNMMQILSSQAGIDPGSSESIPGKLITEHVFSVTPNGIANGFGGFVAWDEDPSMAHTFTVNFGASHTYQVFDPTVSGSVPIASGTADHVSVTSNMSPLYIVIKS